MEQNAPIPMRTMPPIGTIVRVKWIEHIVFDEERDGLNLEREGNFESYKSESSAFSIGEILFVTAEHLVLRQGNIGNSRRGIILVRDQIRGIEILKEAPFTPSELEPQF